MAKKDKKRQKKKTIKKKIKQKSNNLKKNQRIIQLSDLAGNTKTPSSSTRRPLEISIRRL